MKSVMQGSDRLFRVATPAHADFVQAIAFRVIADGERERQSVLHHHRVAADVSFAADATELMHAGIRADIRAVIDSDVTSERSCVGHNHVIANESIVRDVSLGHNESVIADLRQPSSASSATMDGDELA